MKTLWEGNVTNTFEVELEPITEPTKEGKQIKAQDELMAFLNYCVAHPHQRFWQALSNWCGGDVKVNGENVFYKETITEPTEPKITLDEANDVGVEEFMKKEQSLEEKMCEADAEWHQDYTNENRINRYKLLAQIAKEHYQEHPEELGLEEYWKEKAEILEEEREMWWSKSKTPDECFLTVDALNGMVSLDKVLEVLQDIKDNTPLIFASKGDKNYREPNYAYEVITYAIKKLEQLRSS